MFHNHPHVSNVPQVIAKRELHQPRAQAKFTEVLKEFKLEDEEALVK